MTKGRQQNSNSLTPHKIGTCHILSHCGAQVGASFDVYFSSVILRPDKQMVKTLIQTVSSACQKWDLQHHEG